MNNNEDFEIDNLLENTDIFKPITKGLGFHHSIKEEREVKKSLNEKSIDLKNELESRARALNLKSTQINQSNLNKTQIDRGDLTPFYESESKAPLELAVENNLLTDNIKDEADIVLRFLAWSIDITMVFSLIAISCLATIFLTKVPLSFVRDNFVNLDIMVISGLLVSMMYLFYFSFFDKTKFSTIGKRVLGLRVVGISDQPITMMQAFARATITMISFFTLGLGAIIKVQDKITDTKVIKI